MPLFRTLSRFVSDLFFSSTYSKIIADTADGADNKNIIICGGGDASSARGATLIVCGNESVETGRAALAGGNVSGGHVTLQGIHSAAQVEINTGGNLQRWVVNSAGDLAQNATNGGSINLTRADTGLTYSAAAGSFIVGTTTTRPIELRTNNAARMILDGGELAFTSASTVIRTNTADGSDNKSIFITGGGAVDAGRGAAITLHGNEATSGGNVMIESGSASGANVIIANHSSSGVIFLQTGNNVARWAVLADGTFQQNPSNGGSITLTKASTTVTPGPCTTDISAAGSIRTDATALTATVNNVTTVSAGQGVALWAAPLNSVIKVRNQGANALNVYPESGTATINGGAGGASVSVAAGTLAEFWKTGATAWIAIEFTVSAA